MRAPQFAAVVGPESLGSTSIFDQPAGSAAWMTQPNKGHFRANCRLASDAGIPSPAQSSIALHDLFASCKELEILGCCWPRQAGQPPDDYFSKLVRGWDPDPPGVGIWSRGCAVHDHTESNACLASRPRLGSAHQLQKDHAF